MRLHIHHKYLWLLIAVLAATSACDRRKQGENGDLAPTTGGAPDAASDPGGVRPSSGARSRRTNVSWPAPAPRRTW